MRRAGASEDPTPVVTTRPRPPIGGSAGADASQVSPASDTTAVPNAVPEDRRLDALRWGDDYELLFTLPAGVEPSVEATRIGRVEPRGFVTLFLDGEPIANSEGLGYLHR